MSPFPFNIPIEEILTEKLALKEVQTRDVALMAEAKAHGDGHVVVRRDDGDGTVYPVS